MFPYLPPEDAVCRRLKMGARLFAWSTIGLIAVLYWATWTGRLICASGPCEEVIRARGLAAVMDAVFGSVLGGVLGAATLLCLGVATMLVLAYTRRSGRTLWF